MGDEAVRTWAGERGYRVGWGPPEVVVSARADLLERSRTCELDEWLFREELLSVSGWEIPDWTVSVVVVVTPSKANRVCFDLGDRVLDTILPPTYLRYRGTFEEVRSDLEQNGLPGRRIEHLHAPLKAVAARLGLVRYGRNNLTYSDWFGSYLQLCGYATDAALDGTEQPPQDPLMLSACDGCKVCRQACPTGAIDRGRILVHAERCLTFANERPGDWPDWVPASAHHCLMGCLACQMSCPANPKLSITSSGITFTFDETRVLLGGEPSADWGSEEGIRDKLISLGQPSSGPVLGRNLRALIDRRVRSL